MFKQKDEDMIHSTSFEEIDEKVQPKSYGFSIEDSILLLK